MLAYQVLQKIKSKSWSTKQEVLKERGQDFKFLNTYSINALLEKPKDWNAIAQKCSDNPNHEMYGKPVEEILADWKSRGKKGQNRGLKLDSYIQAKLSNKSFDIAELDEIERLKCSHFDTTYEKFFKDMALVGQEVWLTSKLGVNVRLDALFLRPNENAEVKLLIIDWKNNETITTFDRWNKLIGPASHLDQCDIVKMTLQIYIYRYILEEYGISNSIIERVFQYTVNDYFIHKPAFEYDAKFIEEIIEFCFKTREENERQ